jgi:protein gp37
MSDETYKGPYHQCHSERETMITCLAVEKALPTADVSWIHYSQNHWAVIVDPEHWPQFRKLDRQWIDVVDDCYLRSVLFRINDLN